MSARNKKKIGKPKKLIPKKPTEVKSLSVELVGKVLLNSRDRKPYYGNAKKLGMRKK